MQEDGTIKNMGTGTWAHQVAHAMEEQLRQGEQELKVWEQKEEAKEAKRIRGIVHENDKNRQDEMGNSCFV